LYVLEERGRIAHDLHDGTIQALYAIGLECDSLSNREDFPGEAREAFAAA
jgi:signal transduction histidine kinase